MPDALPDPAPRPTRLADYRPPDFVVDTVDLVFDLGEADTRVASHVTLRRNPTAATPGGPLRLDGDEVELVALALDGRSLAPADYQREPDGGLVVPEVPDSFALDIETRINPERNTALSGLYISGGNFCTQCEPEGFRRITYFLDRPDVMARYTVTIRADKARFPVLLSNGNPAGGGDLPDGRHWAKWIDPHPKPSYLFALVAGDLVPFRDEFTTRAGQARHRDRQRLPGHRDGDRPRIFPQLDRRPGDLPRLVPAVVEGRADRVPRPAVLGRSGQPRGVPHRQYPH